jgi:hypothetical protein
MGETSAHFWLLGVHASLDPRSFVFLILCAQNPQANHLLQEYAFICARCPFKECNWNVDGVEWLRCSWGCHACTLRCNAVFGWRADIAR